MARLFSPLIYALILMSISDGSLHGRHVTAASFIYATSLTYFYSRAAGGDALETMAALNYKYVVTPDRVKGLLLTMDSNGLAKATFSCLIFLAEKVPRHRIQRRIDRCCFPTKGPVFRQPVFSQFLTLFHKRDDRHTVRYFGSPILVMLSIIGYRLDIDCFRHFPRTAMAKQ